MAADERVLGNGALVESVLLEADRQEGERLQLTTQRMSLSELERRVAQAAGLEEGAICTARRRRVVVQARRAFSQVAVRRLGYAGAEVARYLGVPTSCVNWAAGKSEWENLAKTVFEPASPS